MARWTCRGRDREFGRAHQSHTCVPGNSVERTFVGRPPEHRAIYDAILAHLTTLGPVHVDAVTVGVFLKAERKLAELRPKSKWLACTLYGAQAIDDPRGRVDGPYVVDAGRERSEAARVADVDEQLCAWLTAAYDEACD